MSFDSRGAISQDIYDGVCLSIHFSVRLELLMQLELIKVLLMLIFVLLGDGALAGY